MVVYIITNKLNGKQYIGQTTQAARKRFMAHCSVGSGTMNILKSSIIKYGKENFDYRVLSECSNIEQLNDAEMYWIEYMQTKAPYGYNIASGGLNQKHSEQSKIKMSKARKGIQKPTPTSFPSISVICVETNQIFESITKAANVLKLQRSNIQKVLYKERNHTGGYTFRKADSNV